MGFDPGIVTPATKPKPNLDGVGIWWVSWACIWTLLLAGSMAFLVRHRHLPMLRIRGLGLSLTAIALLHLFWVNGQLGYVVAALAPPQAEYWIMGTYFPFGIALFHASNARFLHVAKRQQKFFTVQGHGGGGGGGGCRPAGLLGRFRSLDYSARTLVLVGLCMLLQLFLTVFVYLSSRKFHPAFGLPGTHVDGSHAERNAAMGKGWEWWPTCFWQLAWAWVVAPIVLWKSRAIKDVHGWRLQTIGCTLANLHATPMWLIALYVPAFEPVNKYFFPPQWICLSIFFMEIFTVLVPCWEVLRYQSLHRETLDCLAKWEAKNRLRARKEAKSLKSSGASSTIAYDGLPTTWKKKTAGAGATGTGTASAASSSSSPSSSPPPASVSSESILTMGALEHVLERNPAPLQQYSALRDFSGENVAFLVGVAGWKDSLPSPVRRRRQRRQLAGPEEEEKHEEEEEEEEAARDDDDDAGNARELVRERFNGALRIYAQFVSARDAEFPINISSAQRGALEAVFEGPTRLLYGEKRAADSVAPFGGGGGGGAAGADWDKASSSSTSVAVEAGGESGSEGSPPASGIVVVGAGDRAQFWGEVPDGFDETVFDEAYKSIKYLVLTNTWPKFVRDWRASNGLNEDLDG